MTDTTTRPHGDDDSWGVETVTPEQIATAVTDQLAQRAGTSPASVKHPPSTQQRAVIRAGRAPALVVAGAGSGKTETMSDRVLWLVANGHVAPHEILGLTFTRKAAGELDTRIRSRLALLADADLTDFAYDEFDRPTIATYNSFANSIFHDHAVTLGREADASVLGEAAAWQLARSVVLASRDPRLIDIDKSLDTVTRAVLDLSHAMSENTVDSGAISRIADEFARLEDLPLGGRAEYQGTVDCVRTVGTLGLLADLADEFAAEKLRRGFVEYADQVDLALRILHRNPAIAADLRDRYTVVLLDEYQDTSTIQTRMLATLFADTPVMAVGDPNQSIYGWRGASAANLADFPRQFATTSTHQEYSLSTSWRNGSHILTIANTLVEPLTRDVTVPVEPLTPSPAASAHPVDVEFTETIVDEARAAAEWLRTRVSENTTAAMLFRTRKSQRIFTEALRDAGVPYHVLGVGGLLSEPEIADIVCALTVIDDPTAGSELVRLLAGSRWRIAPKDLHALSSVARWLEKRDLAQQEYTAEIAAQFRASVAEGESGSIADALDFITRQKREHTQLAGFSETGLARLRDAGTTLARLRSRRGLALHDFVTLVEQELLLDIETIANDTTTQGAAAMEAFTDAVDDYLTVSDSGHLRGFLSWLAETERRENRTPRTEPAEPGVVQILTIHGSKGLEWDHVVVPRLVQGELPGKPQEGFKAWLRFGVMPYELRGDRDALPALAWRNATTRKELTDAIKDFIDDVKAAHESEERRLAYVAVTRARHSLLLTASFWDNAKNARPVSPFLTDLVDAEHIPAIPTASTHDTNPLAGDLEQFRWPLDPLGGRRERVERAAELVRNTQPGTAGHWQRDIDLLLAERDRATAGGVRLPQRFAASRFKDFISDPAAAAHALRRPMPERPYRASRLGTHFHAWVEEKYGVGALPETIDAFELDTTDDLIDADKLDTLKATFENSPYASLKPVEVEREIQMPFGGHTMVCKLDAVYHDGQRWRIVDWKTGVAPRTADELEERQLQLALYRLAFSRWKNIDPEFVDAEFYYVADDRVISPPRLYTETELVDLFTRAKSALTAAATAS